MATYFLPTPHDDMPRTGISELPAFKPKDRISIASQIASHLKQLLRGQAAGTVCMTLPSSIELAEFYHCSALDVLDALYCLKNHQYEYAMNGLDSDIALYGPIVGQRPAKRLPIWLYPWERAHKVTENPMMTLFENQL